MKLDDFSYPRMSLANSPLWLIRAKKQADAPWTKKDATAIAKDYESRGYIVRIKGAKHSSGTAYVVYIRKKSHPLTTEERQFAERMVSARNEESARRHRKEMGF